MEIERAIRLLVEQYNKALKMDKIDNPVSFAAFMVMREADSDSSNSKPLTVDEIYKRDGEGHYVMSNAQRLEALIKLKQADRR